MLGLHRLNAIFGAAPVQTPEPGPVDPADLVAYLRQLSADVDKGGCGLHLLFCRPGTEEIMDLRTPKNITDAEEVWEQTDPAERVGTRDALDAEGMATTTSATLSSWLRRGLKQLGTATDLKCGPVDGVPNLACNIAASRVVVVEAETDGGIDAFKSWAAQISGDEMWRDPFQRMTVQTPSGGGQFWFTLPGDGSVDTDPSIRMDTTPASMRVSQPGGSFTIRLHSAHVMVPGAQTDTGVWRVVGEAIDTPDWFLGFVDDESRRRLEGAQDRYNRQPRFGETATAWSERTDWSAVLTPLGWSTSQDADVCGCPVFTNAEASHHITTHQPGCMVEPCGGVADSGARFWESPPQGSSIEVLMSRLNRDTLSRFELAAALYVGGDLPAAKHIVETTPATLTGGDLPAPAAPAPEPQPAAPELEPEAAPETVDLMEQDAESTVVWAPAGEVTTIADESALDTLSVEIVEAGPGTTHPLGADMESWNAMAGIVSEGSVDLVVVRRFDELAGSLGIDPDQAAEWLIGNLTTLSAGTEVAVAVVRTSK